MLGESEPEMAYLKNQVIRGTLGAKEVAMVPPDPGVHPSTGQRAP